MIGVLFCLLSFITLIRLMFDKISLDRAEQILIITRFEALFFFLSSLTLFIYFKFCTNLHVRYSGIFLLLLAIFTAVNSYVGKKLFYTLMRIKVRL